MIHSSVKCNSRFYSDVGFDLILKWLTAHCLCKTNEDYFSNLIPSSNLSELEESQSFTDELLASLLRDDSLSLEKIADISIWLDSLKIRGYQLTPENFSELYDILVTCSRIKPFLKKGDFPLWYINSRGLLNSNRSRVAIEDVFDNNFQIKADASLELKRLTRAILRAEERIKEKMQAFFLRAKQQNWLKGDQIAWRNGRSVLPLKVSQKRKIKGIVQDQSATGQTVFIEPLEIIELNNQLMELQFSEIEEKNRILKELTSFFKPLTDQIRESYYILQHLDQHYTRAKLAHHLKAIRPELTENDTFILNQALNPLFTLSGRDVVALNLKLNNERILLLSGPNAGGKTVVLKSLGLYVLMAQCGLFIPAKKARLPVFSSLMADIGDHQSIADDLSTFSAHIQNLAEIVEKADENTLILLDELGTGTDPDAGAALSRAILESLLLKNSVVAATTHLGSLKVWASEEPGILNGGMVFNTEALAPTYVLQLGTPGASYALEISKRMGLNTQIIKRSQELVGDGSLKLENILAQLEKERSEAESLRVDLMEREKTLLNTEQEIAIKTREIQKTHKKAKSTAADKAEEIILSARREAENLIANIRQNQADKKSIHKAQKQISRSLKSLKDYEQDRDQNHKIIQKEEAVEGTRVIIPHLDSAGEIILPPDKKGKVTVESNGIKITLNLSELQLPDKPATPSPEEKTPVSLHKTGSLESIQIDLRGNRVDEALQETEQFLDSAILSGLGFVYILHGKGTGALMDAIHEYLNNQSFVSDFHFADEDQGGAGITVVKLKILHNPTQKS